MLVGERGMLSLTMEGGRVLAGQKSYWVEIDPSIESGNIFAMGVTGADQRIRSGDDVVVVKNGEPYAVGVAKMAGFQMGFAGPEGMLMTRSLDTIA